jgi:hypothetical protein
MLINHKTTALALMRIENRFNFRSHPLSPRLRTGVLVDFSTRVFPARRFKIDRLINGFARLNPVTEGFFRRKIIG